MLPTASLTIYTSLRSGERPFKIYPSSDVSDFIRSLWEGYAGERDRATMDGESHGSARDVI